MLSRFYSPLTRHPGGVYQKNCYNDARLASKGSSLLSRMIEHQSNVVHQISVDAAEEKSFYRFLSNPHVSPGEMIDQLYRPSITHLAARSLVVLGDSSEVSLRSQIKSMKDSHRVGVLSDNKTSGFYLHSHLVLDAQSGHGLGLSDLLFWMRTQASQQRQKAKTSRRTPWEQKETYAWQQGIEHSQSVLGEAKEILYVFDSAADIANLWARAKDQAYDLLIRTQKHDRKVLGSDQKLYALLDQLEVAGSYSLPLTKLYRRNTSKPKAQKRTKRIAQMEVRFSKVVVQLKAEMGKVHLPLYAIDARERADSVPEGEEAVHWRLLTSRVVETLEQAMKIIQFYEWRWQTEQLYRTSKKKGFAIEATELESLDAILKQTILSLVAAFRVMSLVISRDKDSQQDIGDLFSCQQIDCMEVLNAKYEGKTKKQQNPWPKDQLAWAAWLIARLGGWKGYQSRRPPGPIRMKRGLDKFYTYFEAWKLFMPEIDLGDP